MKKLKVVTVVGTRPEIIRLSRVISKLRDSDAIEHTLIHTGQNYDYELNQVFFEDLELAPPEVYLKAAGKTAIQTIANVLTSLEKVLYDLKPDAFLVLGDTNSCLSSLVAKRNRIPIFHMEAGNRSFDFRVPEETNRRIVDNVADINLTYSDISREHLIREGFPPDRVIKTGSPMLEVIQHFQDKANKSAVLETLKLHKGEFYLVSAHREENIDSPQMFEAFLQILETIADTFGLPVIVTTHPRTKKRIEANGVKVPKSVSLCKPFGFSDYLKLQMSAKAVLSDSGTISEESSILNFPALNIRESHERPEAMEETAVMMVGMDKERVLQGLEHLRQHHNGKGRRFPIVRDYDVPNVSDKVTRLLISYVDYVKRTVWYEG